MCLVSTNVILRLSIIRSKVSVVYILRSYFIHTFKHFGILSCYSLYHGEWCTDVNNLLVFLVINLLLVRKHYTQKLQQSVPQLMSPQSAPKNTKLSSLILHISSGTVQLRSVHILSKVCKESSKPTSEGKQPVKGLKKILNSTTNRSPLVWFPSSCCRPR